MPRARRLQSRTVHVGDDKASIHQMVSAIREQIDASMDDPQTRTLAASLVAGSYEWVADPRVSPASGQYRPLVLPYAGLGYADPRGSYSGQVATVRYHDRYYRVALGRPLPPCQARDHRCEMIRIWNFLVLNVRYTGDQDNADGYQDLRTTLETGAGDCDDFVIAFCALLRSVGIRCGARVVSLKGDTWDHIYTLALIPRVGWVPLDPTEKDKLPGWEFNQPADVIDFDLSGEGR